MAEEINRITLIHKHGNDEQKIYSGAVEYDGEIVMAGIPESESIPLWEQRGMDIVAGRKDGTVAAAFTVTGIRKNIDHKTRPGKWRIYLGKA